MNYLFQGFVLILQPGLKRYVFIPLLINIALFIGLFFLSKHFFHQLSVWVMQLLPTWLQWLQSILWIVFAIGFFFVILYTFVTLANIIAAPFNNLLSEKVEIFLGRKPLQEKSMKELMMDIPRTIMRQLQIIGYYIPRALVLAILFFVPIIQIFAGLLWFFFHAWLMTLQYIDYPADNHRIDFPHLRAMLLKKRSVSLSFGMASFIVTMIPFLNFISMPASVAGGTALWVREFCDDV
ncbi:MAG TPA: sulfate transporter CysZ [Gammaproteobacteria bacterium]|jgi:CysZ protein|nr:sulfate transporter CysZ [Gammaproteobacteria bacterium]